jgi:hypothetical protein
MATRKVRRFNGTEESSVTADELEIANNSEDPIASLNAQKGWTGSEEKSGSSATRSMTPAPAKQRVVSKKELEESGLSLRDFLNKERGLTRRGEPASSKSSSPSKASPKSDTSNYSNEGRGKGKASSVDQIPTGGPAGWKGGEGEKIDSTELGRNINNALNATPGIQAVGRIAGAGKAAQSGSRALAAAETPLTFLGKSGRRQVGGFDEIASRGAKELSNNPTRQLSAPAKQITGPTKRDLVSRDRAARAAKRQAEMGEENASRYALDPKSSDYAEKAGNIRKNLGGDEWSLGMKRGGKVKTYKAGGQVKSESKPAVKGWGMARGARPAKMR